MTADGWTPEQLRRLDGQHELEIAAMRADGSPGRWTTVWVVRAGDAVAVRTWYRRTTGWWGRAVASGRARIRLADEEVAVSVEDARADERLGDAVDAAYRRKYGVGGVDRMVGPEARATTLRLVPA